MDSRDAWCATKKNQSFDIGEDLMLPVVEKGQQQKE
jgi:hypothetical protein